MGQTSKEWPMTENDTATGRAQRPTESVVPKLAALAVTLLLVVAVLPASATGSAAAAGNDAVITGDVVYETDSGLTVTDTTGADVADNPFDDGETLDLVDLTLSAASDTGVTVDQRTGDYTNLTAIDASTDITVDPADKQPVVLQRDSTALDFASVDFDATNEGVDLTYEAGSTVGLTIQETGLPEGATVEAIDTDSGATLTTATVDASGAVAVTGLPSGSHAVDLEDPATRPSGGGRDADTTPPTADAGPNRTVTVGEPVTLDGSGSSDDEEIDHYQWSLAGEFGYRTGETVSWTFDGPGEYTVELSVTDGSFNTDTDTVVVTVTETDSKTNAPETGVTDDTATPETGETVSPIATVAPTTERADSQSRTASPPSSTETTDRDRPPVAVETEGTPQTTGDPRTGATVTSSGSGPGFGVLLTVLGLFGTVCLVRRGS
ncbi:PGF-CTERM protein [Halorientalis persicus]|uniref:PGF-CTERM protein n=2 Tax=Halorientalis persicus TaxID=1367881 RepID=A0A1H8JMR7_9EURY|nr:PGF-CTERM protein [Halorientalis persicus]